MLLEFLTASANTGELTQITVTLPHHSPQETPLPRFSVLETLCDAGDARGNNGRLGNATPLVEDLKEEVEVLSKQMLALYEALTDSIESEEGSAAEYELKLQASKEKAKQIKQKQTRERRDFRWGLGAERMTQWWRRALMLMKKEALSTWHLAIRKNHTLSLPRLLRRHLQNSLAQRMRVALGTMKEKTISQRTHLELFKATLALEEEQSKIYFVEEEARVQVEVMEDRILSLGRTCLVRNLTSQLYMALFRGVLNWRSNLDRDIAILDTAERAKQLLAERTQASRDQTAQMAESMGMLARVTLVRGILNPILETERRKVSAGVGNWIINLQKAKSSLVISETCGEARKVISAFRGRMISLAFGCLFAHVRQKHHQILLHCMLEWQAQMHREQTNQEAESAARAFSLSCARAKIEAKDTRARLQLVLQRTLISSFGICVRDDLERGKGRCLWSWRYNAGLYQMNQRVRGLATAVHDKMLVMTRGRLAQEIIAGRCQP